MNIMVCRRQKNIIIIKKQNQQQQQQQQQENNSNSNDNRNKIIVQMQSVHNYNQWSKNYSKLYLNTIFDVKSRECFGLKLWT